MRQMATSGIIAEPGGRKNRGTKGGRQTVSIWREMIVAITPPRDGCFETAPALLQFLDFDVPEVNLPALTLKSDGTGGQIRLAAGDRHVIQNHIDRAIGLAGNFSRAPLTHRLERLLVGGLIEL